MDSTNCFCLLQSSKQNRSLASFQASSLQVVYSLPVLYVYSTCPGVCLHRMGGGGISKKDSEHLERIQRRAVRLILKEPPRSSTPHDILLAHAGVATLASRRKASEVSLAFKFFNNLLPPHIQMLFSNFTTTTEKRTSLRSKLCVRLPRPRTEYLKRSPLYLCLSEWNKLSPSTQSVTSLSVLKSTLSSSAEH